MDGGDQDRSDPRPRWVEEAERIERRERGKKRRVFVRTALVAILVGLSVLFFRNPWRAPVVPDADAAALCRADASWIEKSDAPDPSSGDDTIRIAYRQDSIDPVSFTIYANGHLGTPDSDVRLTAAGQERLERCLRATHVTELGETWLPVSPPGCAVTDIGTWTLSVRDPGAWSTIDIKHDFGPGNCTDGTAEPAALADQVVRDLEGETAQAR